MTATALRTVVHSVDSIPPIGLDELVDRASLLTRLDRKYILPIAELPAVLGELSRQVRVLEIDGRRDFGYQSRYFDTPDLHSYLSTAHAHRRRFKVRIRSYRETGRHFLEVKTRGPRGVTVKHRCPHDLFGDPRFEVGQDRLDGGARAYAGVVLAEARIRGDWTLVPTLTTTYRRTTLFVPATGSRVTIDTDLSWATPDGTTIHIGDRAIVETKSDQSVSDVVRLLWSRQHRPCSVSKYGTGLAALRPGLPANRWRRVLRRHFPGPCEPAKPGIAFRQGELT